MKKIIFKNGQAPYLSDKTANQIQDNIENEINTTKQSLIDRINAQSEANLITASVSNSYAIEKSGYNDVPLGKILQQIGDKLSLVDGKIVIGKGIDYVLVGGQGMLNTIIGNGAAKNFIIRYNNSDFITNMNTAERTSSMNITRGMHNKLLKVNEGDTIGFRVYAGVGDTVPNATDRVYITVQAV